MKLEEFQRYIHKDTIVELFDSSDCDRGWLGTFPLKMIPKDYLDNYVITICPGIHTGVGEEATKLIIFVVEIQ